MRKRIRNERGAALLEAAITIPLILAISVGIFEFGRAFQTWQVLTNAAREGARIAVLADTSDAQVRSAVREYMKGGGLSLAEAKSVVVTVARNEPLGTNNASRISINYPFSFMVLNPVIRLVTPGSNTGAAPLSMGASALMRNEN
ncbi:MAG: pilus assembly protein [Acidobacteria bacterium]|nr:pilus assembly protein [Acidobacteriota bacterium]